MFSMSDVYTARNDLADIIDIRNSKLNIINNHNLRVTEMSVNFAKALNMSSEDINQILIGSYLHDIGKIFLGSELLEGDKPLSVRQKNEIIRHTVLGHRYLNNVDGLDKAKEIILLHHEKVDGTGYPHGLVGSEIPIHVRIVSICDSYDAMTSYRAYRPIKLTHEEAIQELLNNKGTQFDSKLVDVFVSQFDISYFNS